VHSDEENETKNDEDLCGWHTRRSTTAMKETQKGAPPTTDTGSSELRRAQARNPVRSVTLAVIVIGAIYFAYSIVADRLTPYTAQATVQAYLVRIAPEVSGRVIEMRVEDSKPVTAGTMLFRIDPVPYRLAVERAEAQLETAGQAVGSSTAAVASAEANLAKTIAERENVREQTARVFELVEKKVYAKARSDQARAALDTAEAAVSQAEAEVEKARQNLGPQGADNPQVRDAMAALQRAQLDLARTEIFAPSDGGVANLQLTIGQVLGVGQAAMTYIDVRQIWIEAAFRENSLENVQPGDPVEIVLDIQPGRISPGTVAGVGYGVSSRETDPQTGLQTLRSPTGWIRDPQPLPVRIEFDPDTLPRGIIRLGSQANVLIYTGENPVMNALGWIWIRFVAWLTYVS
jgi:multidrug resistance efflux pump